MWCEFHQDIRRCWIKVIPSYGIFILRKRLFPLCWLSEKTYCLFGLNRDNVCWYFRFRIINALPQSWIAQLMVQVNLPCHNSNIEAISFLVWCMVAMRCGLFLILKMGDPDFPPSLFVALCFCNESQLGAIIIDENYAILLLLKCEMHSCVSEGFF